MIAHMNCRRFFISKAEYLQMKLLQFLANEKLNIHLLAHLSNCARKENLKKLLIFCNKRDNVENVAERLWGNPTVFIMEV